MLESKTIAETKDCYYYLTKPAYNRTPVDLQNCLLYHARLHSFSGQRNTKTGTCDKKIMQQYLIQNHYVRISSLAKHCKGAIGLITVKLGLRRNQKAIVFAGCQQGTAVSAANNSGSSSLVPFGLY